MAVSRHDYVGSGFDGAFEDSAVGNIFKDVLPDGWLKKKRGRESFHNRLGRPRLCNVDSKPSRLAMRATQSSLPKGRPVGHCTVSVKAESHSMQCALSMLPPPMPDVLPLTQPRASIDAQAGGADLEPCMHLSVIDETYLEVQRVRVVWAAGG